MDMTLGVKKQPIFLCLHHSLVKSSLCGHQVDTVQVGVRVEGGLAEGLEEIGTVRWVHHPQGALAQVL